MANRIQSTGQASYRKWYGLGISEFRLLVVIGNEPGATGARINEVIGLDVGAISRILRRMKADELVFREEHPRHPSYRCWNLTEKGADLHDRIRIMTDQREAAILTGFSKAETLQLLSYLHRLLDNTGKLEQINEQGLNGSE